MVQRGEVEKWILVDRLLRDRFTVAGKKGCCQYSSGGRGSELKLKGHIPDLDLDEFNHFHHFTKP